MVNPKEDSLIMTTITAVVLMLHHTFLIGASQQLDEADIAIPIYKGGRKVSKRLNNLSKVILLEAGVKLLA